MHSVLLYQTLRTSLASYDCPAAVSLCSRFLHDDELWGYTLDWSWAVFACTFRATGDGMGLFAWATYMEETAVLAKLAVPVEFIVLYAYWRIRSSSASWLIGTCSNCHVPWPLSLPVRAVDGGMVEALAFCTPIFCTYYLHRRGGRLWPMTDLGYRLPPAWNSDRKQPSSANDTSDLLWQWLSGMS